MKRLVSLEGRTALVTGASSGIGRELALRVAREGARVALVARRADALESLAAEIRRLGREALVLPCDVADREEVRDAARRALESFGSIDLLVNNAGYGRHRRFLEWELPDMERMMAVNFLGAVYWTKALLPQMLERRCGWIVFMASVAGRIATPQETVYAASKFALVGFADALSLEVEDGGVHVLTVCPGTVKTSFFDAETFARLPGAARRWMVKPDDLVTAILAALVAGKRELTFPKAIGAAYLVRALAPAFARRRIKSATASSPSEDG